MKIKIILKEVQNSEDLSKIKKKIKKILELSDAELKKIVIEDFKENKEPASDQSVEEGLTIIKQAIQDAIETISGKFNIPKEQLTGSDDSESKKDDESTGTGPFSKAYEAHRAVLEKIIPSLPVPQQGLTDRLEKFSNVFKDIDAKKQPSYTNAQGIDIKIPNAQHAVNMFFSGVLNAVTNSLFDTRIRSDESGHEGMKQSIDLYRALRKVMLSDKFPGSSPVAPDIGEEIDTQQMRVVGRSGHGSETVGGVLMLGDFASKTRPEITVGNYFLEKEKRQQMKESIKITKSYLKQIIKEEIQKVLK